MGSKHLWEDGESYPPGLTHRQYAERQYLHHDEGMSAGDRHPRSLSTMGWLLVSR